MQTASYSGSTRIYRHSWSGPALFIVGFITGTTLTTAVWAWAVL